VFCLARITGTRHGLSCASPSIRGIFSQVVYRWVQRYAPEIEKRIRQYQGSRSGSWRVDETYVRIGGRWKYLFRAVDKHGQFIASMLSDRRDTGAAYRFLRKALKTMSDHPPSSITTDKLASYPKAIRRLQDEGLLSKNVEHRTSKYLNNILEADHGALKRVIRPTRGFQRMRTASATLRGFEVMRMIRPGHCILPQAGVTGEIRLVNQLFGLAA
jgi:transposase, IS6 family